MAIALLPSTVASSAPSVDVNYSATSDLVFILQDAGGVPIDLSVVTYTFQLKAVDSALQATMFDVAGVADPDQVVNTGYVTFTLDTSTVATAGSFVSQVGLFDAGNLTNTWNVTVNILANVFQTTQTGPISTGEVRLALLDVGTSTGGAPFNNLLDDVEFSDNEISYAIGRVVDMWNETPPVLGAYTTSNFPYRYWWTVGICALLLRMGAARYRRNRLQYSAGGVTVDDQSKDKEYEAAAQSYMQEFKEWMLKEKVRINMANCWSTGL
jgi:hypothetical protein